ncbi:hypothetical protein [Streptomyces sp. NPDC050121]|uniref:hypothetical protein n=1 Tax=Streptomyces sp. NPDC050121 TaxID=3365601 RepID=UPI003791A5F3
MGREDELDELDELASKGAEVLEAGLRSEQRETVRWAFRKWLADHTSTSLDRILAPLPPDKSRHFKVGYFRGYFREALSGTGGQEAAADLRALMADLPELQQPTETESGSAADTVPGFPTGDNVPAFPMGDTVPGIPPGDIVGFYGGDYRGPVVGVLNQTTYASPPGVFIVPDPGNWPAVEDADPVTLGVRPTERHYGDPGLPPYVPRDLDERLRGWSAQYRLLVITGGPLTGKSRTAWAAVVGDLDPRARVYAPAHGTDLRGLPALLRGRQGTYVLWLDELEHHLGEHGLTLGLLAELKALGVPVVATMSDDAYETRRFAPGPASQVLSLARSEPVSSTWTPQELGRLRAAFDARLDEAERWRGSTGVTQYLAIGAELRELWHRSGLSNSRHPYGNLLIRAATDLARCGVTGDIPRRLLHEACQCYTARQPAGRLERQSFQEALDWARQLRHDVTGLLVPGAPRRVGDSDETWRPYGSLVVDAERASSGTGIPIAVWRCALAGTAYDAEVHRNVRTTAHAVFAVRAEDGDAEAMHMLGLLAEDNEDEATALEWFRKAVDAGKKELSGRLGALLLARGEAEQALPYLRAAAEQKPGGQELRLVGEAHLALAEQALREAVSGGDMAAAHRLGDLLLGRGELSQAASYYMEAETQGYAPVARSVAVYFLLRHETEIAEVLLTRAAAAGDEEATRLLNDAQEPSGSLMDAAAYFASGHPLDAAHLGAVTEKAGFPEQARGHYEQGCANGDAYAAYRLASLLDKQNDPAEAVLWYGKAADMGHPGAMKALAEHAGNPATVEE